ncbi:major facilitator superfamily multidrug-resistance protein [Scheffersomyces stipitis CBS 6054]|uniref:Major facilitator superfamily multidrug-resistance protein n=1 Tax=Scheffersomyces stipitis (strain ATCC 58785 / CBS 6054 / NBRC 10063 / NRRL Y-11545) TaxID=322104 RepID=A3LSP7_PICST|nr:major facilitator superfamily multidrug-resistance protein [Scheffersomyces stipitis CBS 6054]ABN65612.2 major facilitator superfamily multidrug-resistance protein [Scheffersomyces stipitis CBS 6054]KAG2733500.1 hypothetical protein G9P44_003025 [Scheffersomyces stipitis]
MSLVSDIEKHSQNHIETVSDENLSELSREHIDYLMQRHGTVDLDPLPSMDPEDPLNWPTWRKNYEILIIAFQCFLGNYFSASLTPAYEDMAVQYGVDVPTSSYLTSAQIAVVGVLPFFWVPIMNTYGRRSILMYTAFCAIGINIAGAYVKTYGQQMATRCLYAFCAATASALGSAVVSDLSFSHERGMKNGWWSLGFVLGTPSGPFISGFIMQYSTKKWIFFMFAIFNAIQVVLFFFSKETVYNRGDKLEEPSGIIKLIGIYRRNNNKVTLGSFISPLKQGLNWRIGTIVIALSVTFAYANIVLIVEMPQTFGTIFELSPQALGLHYIALILGSVIGEALAGSLSDWWMAKSIKRRGGKRIIADRLYVSYNGFLLVIIGLVVWGVYLDRARPDHWSISALIGAAIMAVGNNIVATVLITYSIDCNPAYASDIGLFITIVRQVYGFVAPFYFPSMFTNLGFIGSAGLMIGLVFVFGTIVTSFVHFMSRKV